MGLFPTDAGNGDEVTNALGTTFKYVAADDKWIIVNTITISNLIYNEGTWNANSDGATKDAIRDKIVLMDALIDANISQVSEDPAPKMYINSALANDGDFEGTILKLTHTVVFGKAVYISGNNTGGAADKDAIGTMLAVGVSVGDNEVLISGTIREDDWDWTANDIIFVGDDGALTNDISGYTAGDMAQVVGVATNPNEIVVKGLDWVEIV